MELSLIVLGRVLVMFGLMLVGIGYAKWKKLTPDQTGRISDLLLTIVVPCMLVDSFQIPYDSEAARDLLFSAGLAVFASILSILLTHFIFTRKNPGPEGRVGRFGMAFGNVGFIGVPLISGVFGDEAIIFAAAYMVAFNIFSWTYGVVVLKGSARALSFRQAVLNPGVIGTVVAVPLFAFGIMLPDAVGTVVRYIGSMQTPLAMLVCGFFLSKVDFRKIFTGRILYISFVRLLAIPLVTLGVYWLAGAHTWMPSGEYLLIINLIASACPSAITTSLMADRFGLDGEYGAKIVAVTTLCSIITVPLLVYLSQMAFGVL
ncbi:MAG: AEC family transporter [Oscillospiraceae bacterium]|nr:AEC family transporter [Oscillospiraceae bacterium]MDY4190605.1 AEC family transporter [Oscillospiraceae bacterium]